MMFQIYNTSSANGLGKNCLSIILMDPLFITLSRLHLVWVSQVLLK